jgi:protein gp37
MAPKSKIEWTESTWNPITGCTKISEGCLNCYAERMAHRLQAMDQEKYKKGFELTLHPKELAKPLSWKKSHVIFVCSMSDLFHKDVPDEYIQNVFNTMNKAHWHTFQVLTKRSDRLASLSTKLKWTPNIWMGVTVESQNYTNRISDLIQVPATVRFLSVEPMIGPIDNLPLNKVDWVIVGGESGPGARYLDPDWVISVKNQCQKSKVPFFFKQWGGVNKKKNGRLLEGITWSQQPQQQKLQLVY